ncbi:PspC domain-containing protein [Alkalibacter saccharofermentans]|uniref:Phage shock protein C (PspC) family protein n=1 Tax=Alkalibacter saccharofermentans DSM 14828 TaxID=1120975 RepID=A0A1M4X9L1_9FIRM|nr:PspC domain-containing protein [Alkalibacter saccharofermentans]SHE90091.1 phage shock protein C (PspC) family protein [Alkalibacter saccharofermentans DSM 14828]
MNSRLFKSRKDKMILGVCGGVAKYMQIDASIIRILWAIAALFYGSGVLLYLIAAFILPYEDEIDGIIDESKNGEAVENDENQKKVIGTILIAAGLLLLFRNFRFFFDMDIIWSGLLILLGFALVFKERGKNK